MRFFGMAKNKRRAGGARAWGIAHAASAKNPSSRRVKNFIKQTLPLAKPFSGFQTRWARRLKVYVPLARNQ
jgi:hypothetical protein